MQEEMLEGYRLSPQQNTCGCCTTRVNVSYQRNASSRSRAVLRSADSGRLAHKSRRAAQNSAHELSLAARDDHSVQASGETGDICWQEDDLSGVDERASLVRAFFPKRPPAF